MGTILELRVVLLYDGTGTVVVCRPGSRRFVVASCQPRFQSHRSIVAEAPNVGIVGTEELREDDEVTAKHACGCLTGSKRL